MEYLYIPLGLILLVVGGELLVRGASGIALKMRITPLIVGLTVVSFATSAPELIVSVQASMRGYPDIALGNVIGSNIANIGLILGLTAMIFSLPVTWRVYRLDWWVMMGASVLLGLFLYDNVLQGWEGAILVGGLIGYIVYKIKDNKNQQADSDDIPDGADKMNVWILILLVAGAVLALRFGAIFLVKGAVKAAIALGVEERIISLTIVAFGTSVPELAASVMAAVRGQKDMAIGNVIGSNIFNIFSVLGFSSIIIDIPVQTEATLHFDWVWMMGFAFLIWPLMSFFNKGKLGRLEGGVLFGAYILYIYLLT